MSRPIPPSTALRQAAHRRSASYLRRLASAAVAMLCSVAVGLLTVPSGTASAAGSTLKAAADAKGIYFGGIMSSNLLNNSTATSLAANQFNMITPENEMKWDTTEPNRGQFNYQRADDIVNWALARNMRVRGHTLVWWNPDANQLPDWVKNLPQAEVRAAMENHVRNLVAHYKGKLYAWDVVNEPFEDNGNFRDHWFYKAMGPEYIAIALQAARDVDPNVKLYLNDYNIEANNTAKSNAMYNLARSLKERNLLDGVGFESHFEVGRPPGGFQENLARFAALGLDVAITEWDDRMPTTDPNTQTPVNSDDLNRQASEVAAVVTACLNTRPRCVGFSQWAVGDADSWVPKFPPMANQGAATLFDVNYNPKPAFHSVLSALGGGGTPTPTPTPSPSGGSTSLGAWVWLIGAQSSKCLDAPGGDGVQLILYTCNGGANQAYLLHADGTIRVRDKCLDAPTGATSGSKLQVWGCNPNGATNQNQKWTLNTDGQLKSQSTSLCVDVWGQGTTDWTPVALYTCHNGANQKWGFSQRPIVGNASGRCLDAPAGGGNGTQLQLWDCANGNVNQALTLTADGELRVKGKCLDVPTGGTAGAKLQIWDCSGQPNQKWVLSASGRIINPASGLCIDASNYGTANGTKIHMWTTNGISNQLWHM